MVGSRYAGVDWDDANREHIARHGVSYEEAEEAFGGTTLELGYEVVDGEERLEEVGKTPAVMVSHEDYAVAKKLAEKKGVPHETYLQGLVHEALERETHSVG